MSLTKESVRQKAEGFRTGSLKIQNEISALKERLASRERDLYATIGAAQEFENLHAEMEKSESAAGA
jgi:predicted  nucleic acid-binding Zn-ribbon protein